MFVSCSHSKWNKACDKAISHTNQLLSSHQQSTDNIFMLAIKPASISRCRLCRRLVRLKINVRRCVVHVLRPHVCANLVDMQKTNGSFAQQHPSGNHVIGCWSAYRRCSRIGFWRRWNPLLRETKNKNIMSNERKSFGTVHGVHAYRDACSLSVLIKCSTCPSDQSLTAHSA